MNNDEAEIGRLNELLKASNVARKTDNEIIDRQAKEYAALAKESQTMWRLLKRANNAAIDNELHYAPFGAIADYIAAQEESIKI